jgi:hypothetical protein
LDRRRCTVRVSPEDEALMAALLADARKINPRSAQWELAADPGLEPGGLIVESDSALIDNSREARRAVVDDVLRGLTLPPLPPLPLGTPGTPGTPGPPEPEDGDAPSARAGKREEAFEPDGTEEEFSPVEEEAAMPAAPPDADPPRPFAEADAPEETEALSPEDAAPGEETLSPEGASGHPPEEDPGLAARLEASRMVSEFLGSPLPAPASDAGPSGGRLPENVADELLADMGFGAGISPASPASPPNRPDGNGHGL